ncbi:Spy/CpxP family protein refolding chaperone [Devosia sp. CN2-171]|uniref:Spy/CpxP family protein refolding chaperone n=1 Tax=Devosia sp. CN2-171 TaxID=3400909 RepID=UPI003BF832B0
MTSTRAMVLAALVAALGLTAMSPAFAAGAPQHQRPGTGDNRSLEFRRDGASGVFQFASFSCAPRAADRLDHRLDRLAKRLELSANQEKLFEDFRTSALTAQTDFADTCDTIRPDRSAGKAERPDLVQRLEQRLKFDEARLAAMTELLPQFKAFYASLSDEQKADLMPHHGFRQGLETPQRGPRFHRPGTPAAPAPGLDG